MGKKILIVTKGGNNNNKKTNPTMSRCKINGKNQICTFRQLNINSHFVKVTSNSYLEILINIIRKNVSSQRTT